LKVGKLILLFAFGVFLFAMSNVGWINATYAQVAPSMQFQDVPQKALTNNNVVTPFSLPTIKLDNASVARSETGPIAVAGPDQVVKEGSTVTLNGSDSRDPNGVILSYLWRQIPTSHIITLNGADTPVWSFTAPRVSSDTTLNFVLMVTDNNGLIDNSTVNVLVRHIPSTANTSVIAGIVPEQTPASSTANTSVIAGIVPEQTPASSTANTSVIAGIVPEQTPASSTANTPP
jgi:hypothetical protein